MHKIDEQKLKEERLVKEQKDKEFEAKKTYLRAICSDPNFQKYILGYLEEKIKQLDSLSGVSLENYLKMTTEQRTELLITQKASLEALKSVVKEITKFNDIA